MKKLIITCLCALIGLCVHSQTQYINPFIGTQGMGHTFPGACVPHGGVQLSPETDTIPHSVDGVYQKEVYKYCAGYQYDDTTIGNDWCRSSAHHSFSSLYPSRVP